MTAKELYDTKAWPALQQCVGCHGSQPAIDWLAPGTQEGAYATVFSFQPPVVVLDAPESSLVLTMGKHTGPALATESAAPILEWLQAERDERTAPTSTPLVVGPLIATLDTMNTVDLGHGATMHFKPAAFDGHLDLTSVDIVTTTALHVAHPLFVSRPAGAEAIIDEVDHFDDVDAVIPASTTLTLTSATFLDFAATDPFTIHFTALEAP